VGPKACLDALHVLLLVGLYMEVQDFHKHPRISQAAYVRLWSQA